MKRYTVACVVACLAVASLPACTSTQTSAEGTCRSDAECNGGLCNTHLKVCMMAAAAAPALEVWPPAQNNQGWVVQEFPAGKLGKADGELEVRLEPGVTVQGLVYALDTSTPIAPKQLPIPARIVAYRDSLLPGRPRVQFETSQAAGKQDSSGQGYVLWLTRGHTYTFYVAPKAPYDGQYPPLVTTMRIDDHTKLDFALEGEDRAVKVVGELLMGGKPLPADWKVRVRAYRPGGLEQSTVAETSGKFELRVPAGLQAYTIRVESAPEQKPIPTMECTGRLLGLVEPVSKVQNVGTLNLPTFSPPGLFTVVIKSKQDGSPVSNATVTFTTSSLLAWTSQNLGYDACSAVYSQSGITDADGRVELPLLGANNGVNRTYSVTVVSPPSSRSASQWVQKLEVGSPGVLQAIELDSRYRSAGKVVCASGRPVVGATIEAQGIAGDTRGPADGLPPSTATTSTGQDGSFELFLDPGLYNITVRPAEGSGLPTLGVKQYQAADVDGLQLALPGVEALRGRLVVSGPQRSVEVPNAQVNVYELVTEIDRPRVHRADLRARSVTDASGLFYLLLPSPSSP
jgi:hypothetical protein